MGITSLMYTADPKSLLTQTGWRKSYWTLQATYKTLSVKRQSL